MRQWLLHYLRICTIMREIVFKGSLYMNFEVLKATESDVPAITEMAGCIWHSCTKEELIAEFRTMLPNPEQGLFLAVSDDAPV